MFGIAERHTVTPTASGGAGREIDEALVWIGGHFKRRGEERRGDGTKIGLEPARERSVSLRNVEGGVKPTAYLLEA